MKQDKMAFSLRAACAILDGYGLSDAEIESVLRRLVAEGKVESSGYVRGGDIDAASREYRRKR